MFGVGRVRLMLKIPVPILSLVRCRLWSDCSDFQGQSSDHFHSLPSSAICDLWSSLTELQDRLIDDMRVIDESHACFVCAPTKCPVETLNLPPR